MEIVFQKTTHTYLLIFYIQGIQPIYSYKCSFETGVCAAAVPVLKQNVTFTDAVLTADDIWCEHPRQMGYVEFLESMNELDFFKHLRVTRTSFDKILYEINVQLGEKPRGRDLPHGTELALWLTLWYLGSQITYCEMGKKFGISEGTVHLCTKSNRCSG